MCATCGCSPILDEVNAEAHGHGPHHHGPTQRRASLAAFAAFPVAKTLGVKTLTLEERVLKKNDGVAASVRGELSKLGVLALNLVSSPGAGKTTLLERTIRELGGRTVIRVVEGDQETENDAERIRKAGALAVQVNTGTGCHLDASMVQGALPKLSLQRGALLFIENVGNLVCPSLFDLGERAKVVVASVTEGEDKPLKYPHIFRNSSVLLLNKVDLLPHLDFDVAAFLRNARQVNPSLRVIRTSAKTGEGMSEWYGFIEGELRS